MILASLSFLLCVVTSFVGIIFFSYSLSHVRDGIELLPRHLRRTAQDFTKFTNDLNVSVHCIHNHQDRKLKDKVEVISKKIKESVDRFKTEINEYRFEDKSIDAVLPPLSDGSDEILGILKRTNKKSSHRISSLLGYTVLIPIMLLALSLLGLAGIMGSWRFYTGSDRFDSRLSRRGATANVASSVLASAGYVALLLGSLLCFMTASVVFFFIRFCFLVAFVAMFVCMGVFEDNDLRLLQVVVKLDDGFVLIMNQVSFSRGIPKVDSNVRLARTSISVSAPLLGTYQCLAPHSDALAVPNLHYTTSFGSQQIVYSLHDILYKCRNDYPFFDAVNGSYLMAEKELSTKFSMSRRYDMAREVQNFHVDPTTLAKMEANTREVDVNLLFLFPSSRGGMYRFQNHASRFEKAVVTNRKETQPGKVKRGLKGYPSKNYFKSQEFPELMGKGDERGERQPD
ncbi:unnamed protein product [Heligmosomoides polygyrus]|uniref:DUF2254 domain-containing protein n=1 Tax=Heligmosomoides polygyrus TaxID=6339 RepID=A0A3P7YLW2_HELPZ|nr:unnamed protein product [Heligmosomoides polygyrus]